MACAIHSIGVGIGLIIRPSNLLQVFGFAECSEQFFPTQGGVFYIVMAAAYILAAINPVKHRSLVIFTIIVKTMATAFLLIYFLFIEHIILVLLSGLGDGLIGLIVYILFRQFQNQNAPAE